MSKLFLISLLVVVLATGVFAQGRGRGGGVGGGRGSGMGNSGGPGVGTDHGMGHASNGSGARSDNGLDRAGSNMHDADKELREHPNLPHALHTNANDLRAGFEAALAKNPKLTFGNFVAATRLAQNLHARFPNITRDAILNGLASGRSLGQTLQDLGLSSDEAKDAKKQAEREIKAARKNN